MKFTSAMQLKGWVKNKSKQTGVHSNVLLQSYMMERLLERISLSPYRKNLILKGGFLIASMVGIDKRTTLDIDATLKGLQTSLEKIQEIMANIASMEIGDGVAFDIQAIKNIRDISEYDDYRISLLASLSTIRVNMSIDITTGDGIIPQEIEYQYQLMFEDRAISILAYNLGTILAEKLETILSRNVANTRGRDFYDAYILLSINRESISRKDLLHALHAKAKERNSLHEIENHKTHLSNIAYSPEIAKIWEGYAKDYPYAKNILLPEILELIAWVFADDEAGQ